MFINITDSRDNIIIAVNKNHIVCVGPDTAHGRYAALIELVNGKLIYSQDPLDELQKVLVTKDKKTI